MPNFSVLDKTWAIVIAVAVVALLFVVPSAWSQHSGMGALTAYGNGVQLSDPVKRLAAMEQFLRNEPGSSLAEDALECATWDSIRLRDATRSSHWGNELVKRSPANPLAEAALTFSTTPDSASGIATLQNALTGLDSIRKPEGFPDSEFADLRRQVWLLLDGSIGLGYVALQRYEEARPYLKLAVSVAPNDPRVTYSYAVALLSGKRPDSKNGFWQLARAVNLSAGSSAGAGIARYARNKYLEDGGSDADWKQFLTVTAIGTANQTRAVAAYSESPKSTGTTPKVRESAPALPPAAAEQSQPSSAAISRPELGPLTDPVSLGILLQTNLLRGENRKAIIDALRSLVRHLRQNDEAFLMAYSDELDFEQDLTQQDRLLDDALVHLKAGTGAALFDGVSFAIGHLDRIGKNRNRVLLVISDGSNTRPSKETTFLTSQISDVRIDCVGLSAHGQNQILLERLAQYSGGRAIFVSDPQQFYSATLQLTQSIGINFPQ